MGGDVQKVGFSAKLQTEITAAVFAGGVHSSDASHTEMIFSRACVFKRNHPCGCRVPGNFHAVPLGSSSAQQHERRKCSRAQF